jgi:hypothetical protein
MVFQLMIALFILKALFIGSSFSFYTWARYGKFYTRWYFDEDRTTFKYIPPRKPIPIEIYIPENLMECFKQLKVILSAEAVGEIENMECCNDVAPRYHFGLGMWIRNNWGLWGFENNPNSRLRIYFNHLGIEHPDDMSGIILTSFWRHLNHLPIKLDEQIKQCQNYWKGQK